MHFADYDSRLSHVIYVVFDNRNRPVETHGRASLQLIPVRLDRIPQHPRLLSFRFSNMGYPFGSNKGNFPMISHLFQYIIFRHTIFII